MLNRLLKAELEKNRQTDVSQGEDITALETAVGTVPAESDDLQTQVSALAAAVGTVPDEADDLQTQITSLAARVKTLEDKE